MTAEQFLDRFALFAELPGAATKMRQLVLGLAVQGKLLGHSAGERHDLLPAGWTRRHLGELADFINGDRSKNYPSKGLRVKAGIPFINAGHLFAGDVCLTEMDYITPEHFDRLGGGKVRRGDVLYCLRGSLGKCAVVKSIDQGAIASSLLIVRPHDELLPEFLHVCLTSPMGTYWVQRFDNGSAQPNLSAANVKKYLLPVPPLDEQERIVATVDELMALCDRLEAQQRERVDRHRELAAASLGRFLEAPSDAKLPSLFHPSYDITPDSLRSLVLGLAVQGRLVPQRDSDRDASAIFGARLPNPEEPRFEVPASWTWAPFASVGEQRLGKMLDAGGNRGELKPYLRNTNVQWSRFRLDDVKQMRLAPDELHEYRLRPGDLMICEGGEPGRCAIWNEPDVEMYFQKAIHRVRPRKGILSEYLALCLQHDARSGALMKYFTGATIKHLTGRALASYSVPVPPTGEQVRIVAKVQQLMSLVDTLEAQQAVAQEQGAALLARVVEVLTGPSSRGRISA